VASIFVANSLRKEVNDKGGEIYNLEAMGLPVLLSITREPSFNVDIMPSVSNKT